MSDQKKELLRLLKGRNVKGFHFSLQEDRDKVVASLTNSAIRKLINMDRIRSELTLGYTWVKDSKKRTSRVFKSEALRNGDAVEIIVRDLRTDRVINKVSFPLAEEHNHAGPANGDTINKCHQEFLCKRGGEMQCEANRTCTDQHYSLICRFSDGSGVSIHGLIRPNTLRCQILSNIPPFEGLVFSR